MKYVYYLCLSGALAIGLSSCQTIYNYRLGAGLHAHDLIYQPKPFAPKDSSVNSAWYVGGVYTVGNGYRGAMDVKNNGYKFGLLQVSRAHSWKHASVSYGAFGFLGSYAIAKYNFAEYDTVRTSDPSSPPNLTTYDYIRKPSAYAGTYHFQGWGLRGSAHLNAIIGRGRKTNWRYLGLEWAHSQEYGSLYDIRQQIPQKTIYRYNQPYKFNQRATYVDNWIVARSRGLTTLALSSEMVFNNYPRHQGAVIIKSTWGKAINADYSGTRWFDVSSIMLGIQANEHLVSLTVGNITQKAGVQLGYNYRLGAYKNRKKRASMH